MLVPNDPNAAIRSSDELARTNAADEKKVPPPPGRKDFKQVLGKDEEKPAWSPKEEKLKKTSTRDDRVATKSRSPYSPPPVAAKGKPKDNTLSTDEDEEEVAEEPIPPTPKPTPSPLSMYQQVAKESSSKAPAWVADAQPMELPSLGKKESSTRKESSSTRFQEAQADSAVINPFMSSSSLEVGSIANKGAEIKASSVSDLQELVNQFIDKLYTVEASGESKTVFIVKNIPLFENAKVTISEFKTAQKEFNLTFENLTQEAKYVLDANMNYLQQALKDNGYARAIHIVTTSTYEETPIIGTTQSAYAQNEREGEQKKQDREKNRDEDSEA